MPVTKTAKRALRSSTRKRKINSRYLSRLEVAIRQAEKSKNKEKVKTAVSLVDRAVSKNIIHKNKAARIKRSLSKLLPAAKNKPTTKSKSPKTKATKKK